MSKKNKKNVSLENKGIGTNYIAKI